jgi:hypothetical protein
MDGCCGDFWTLTTRPKGRVSFQLESNSNLTVF